MKSIKIKCVVENKVWELNKVYSFRIQPNVIQGYGLICDDLPVGKTLQDRLWQSVYSIDTLSKYFDREIIEDGILDSSHF